MSDRYIENYVAMFETIGWKQFIQDTQDIMNSLNYDHCKNYEDFLVMKARREQLQRILSFETQVEHYNSHLQEDDDE